MWAGRGHWAAATLSPIAPSVPQFTIPEQFFCEALKIRQEDLENRLASAIMSPVSTNVTAISTMLVCLLTDPVASHVISGLGLGDINLLALLFQRRPS